MNDGDFEWDEQKAEDNLKKHGVSFEAARRVFDDAWAFDRLDTTLAYEEDDLSSRGLVNGILLTAVYTERGDRTRIISARKATRREEREYHNSQAEG